MTTKQPTVEPDTPVRLLVQSETPAGPVLAELAKLLKLPSGSEIVVVGPDDPWPPDDGPDPRTPRGRALRFLDALARGPETEADAERLLFEEAPAVIRALLGVTVDRNGETTAVTSYDGTDLRDLRLLGNGLDAKSDCPSYGATPHGICHLYCPAGGRR